MNDEQQAKYFAQRDEFNEQGADRVEGLTGVDTQVEGELMKLFEGLIAQVATNPKLQEVSVTILADAIIKGLDAFSGEVSRDLVISRLSRVRARRE